MMWCWPIIMKIVAAMVKMIKVARQLPMHNGEGDTQEGYHDKLSNNDGDEKNDDKNCDTTMKEYVTMVLLCPLYIHKKPGYTSV